MARKPSKKPKKRPEIDWQAIRREYSTGQLTISELSRRHSVSRVAIYKHIEAEGWHQDHSEEVRTLANNKMIHEDAQQARLHSGQVTDELTSCNPIDEKMQDEIELAARTRINVLRQHRKAISTLLEIENKLTEQLLNEPIKTWVGQFKGEIVTHDFGIAVTELCGAYNNLAGAAHKRIQLERQAFNLNDTADKDDGLPTVIIHDPTAEDER